MNEQPVSVIVERTEDEDSLVQEIERYLAAVDAFRAEDCEPTWIPELAPCRTAEECVIAAAYHAFHAH